jgi:hypothetical protein
MTLSDVNGSEQTCDRRSRGGVGFATSAVVPILSWILVWRSDRILVRQEVLDPAICAVEGLRLHRASLVEK